MVYVYTARKMTGVRADSLVKAAKYVRDVLARHNIAVLDPVLSEHVRKSRRPLHNSFSKLKEYWFRDKRMIRRAHVLLDLTGPEKSEGVAHEIGYCRYYLWKPTVRIYPDLGPSVARIEDDYIAGSLDEAADLINTQWGTYYKRLKWRLLMLNRCLPKFLWHQIREVFK